MLSHLVQLSKLDLALLKIRNAPMNLPSIAFADPKKVEIGDFVTAIGHPEQAGTLDIDHGDGFDAHL